MAYWNHVLHPLETWDHRAHRSSIKMTSTVSLSLTMKQRPQPNLDYKQPVHGDPTDVNTWRLVDIRKKTSPDVPKQPFSGLTCTRRHSDVTLHSGVRRVLLIRDLLFKFFCFASCWFSFSVSAAGTSLTTLSQIFNNNFSDLKADDSINDPLSQDKPSHVGFKPTTFHL